MTPTTIAKQPHSLGTACDLLANSHRRIVLDHLRETESTTATLADLAAVVQTHVDGVESVQQARTTLLHMHLPKLADHEIIEYDQHRETVHYHGDTQIEMLLELGGFYE